MAFDVNLGCSGYVYALSIAAALIETSTVSNALVICAETYSKYIVKTDRTCRPIFSDAAAATLVVASQSDCIGPFDFGTDGSGALNLVVLNSGAKSELMADGRLDRTIFMTGSAVFMFTMKMVPVSVMNLVRKRGISIDEIDLFIFHQASQLVLENIVRRLQLKPEKVFLNMGEIGNTVSASIPIAIKDAVNRGVLKPGQRIMLVGFGVGYSWGACLVEWGG
jgi:3-oxoacyl-[acyl-carrier-protein] synthase-3